MSYFKIISLSRENIQISSFTKVLNDPVMPISTAIELLCSPEISVEEAAGCISELTLKRAAQILSHTDMLNEKAAEILNSALIPFSRVLDIFISKYMTDNKIAAILASPKINISLAARLLGRSNRISIERIRIILTDPVMPIKRARQIVENENMPKEKRGKLSF